MAPTALYAAFQVRQAQEAPAILSVAAQLLVVVGAICAYLAHASGPIFALLLVAREATNVVGLRLLGSQLLGYWPKAGFRGRGLGTFMKAAAIYGLAALVHNIYFHGDVFLVSAYRGQSELGAYAAALRPINPLLSLPWIVMVPMVPVLAQLAADDRRRFTREIRSCAAVAIGIGAAGAVVAVLLAPDLLRLLYGGRYLDGDLSAVATFRWLSLAFGSLCVTPVFATAMLADGRERQLLGYGVVALALNLALNLWGLPRLGFVAAAMATAVTQLAVCATLMTLVLAADQDRAAAVRWLQYLGPAAVIAVVLSRLPGAPVVRVGCGVVLGSAAVALLLRGSAGRRRDRRTTDTIDATPAATLVAEPLAVDV
jgi:O-antigen/teichoic acid export membrane protein